MARAPFLDKFNSRKSEHGVRNSLAHVMSNIEAILNTKQGYGFFRHDFGLGDYTAKFGTRDLVETLTREIIEEISQHEPRLKDVEVELRGRDSSLRVHFGVKGVFNGERCKLRLLFHTVSGQVQVEEDT